MTFIVEGEHRPDGIDQRGEDGAFDRVETVFRDRIGEGPEADFPVEPDRYHLYVSRACPWAHGAVLVRSVLGLEDVVSMDVLDPYRDEGGWRFSPDRPGCSPDTVNGDDYLRETYLRADPDYTGKVSVPVLWDREADTIVNNESIEIMRMLAAEFGDLAANDVDLYPEAEREAIDRVVEEVYRPVNNGVYRAGFAETQSAHETAVTELFAALDRWEDVLAERRYLLGESLTLADLRLFPTLVRFDPVYHTHFKCNVRRLRDYPNLWAYTKELYQLPAVEETVEMDHIKNHYYRTHEGLNPKGIVPVGPDVDFSAPHDRDRLPGGPPAALVG